jgi:hypothetical protein
MNDPSLTPFLYITIVITAFLLSSAWGNVKSTLAAGGKAKLAQNAATLPPANLTSSGVGAGVNQAHTP